MNTIPAANILDQCEQALRQSAGTALAAGDYDTARQIIAWAEHVAAMAAIARSPHTPAPESPPAGSAADALVGRRRQKDHSTRSTTSLPPQPTNPKKSPNPP